MTRPKPSTSESLLMFLNQSKQNHISKAAAECFNFVTVNSIDVTIEVMSSGVTYSRGCVLCVCQNRQYDGRFRMNRFAQLNNPLLRV